MTKTHTIRLDLRSNVNHIWVLFYNVFIGSMAAAVSTCNPASRLPYTNKFDSANGNVEQKYDLDH